MNNSSERISNRDLHELYKDIYTKADRIVESLLLLMFLFGIFIAFFYNTWFVALGVGSICLFAYFSTKRLLPDSHLYQYVLSTIFAVFAAQYIYQMHGMAEMHFWVFISSTVLIIYQNWKLQIPLILIVYIHHGTFAYLQYAGYPEMYFTRLDYMDLTTFLFHGILATSVCMISAFWSYNLRNRTVQDALNFKVLSELQEELKQNAERMDELNKYLMTVNKDVQNKNEELQASEEELSASAEELKQINENLSNLVENRTQALIKQNQKLIQYAFINAHKVRSPLARILGLVNLMKYEIELTGNSQELIKHLKHSANELDDILNEVKINLQDGEFKE